MKNNLLLSPQNNYLLLKWRKFRAKNIQISTNSLFHNNIQFKRSRVEDIPRSKMSLSISNTEALTRDHLKTLKKIHNIQELYYKIQGKLKKEGFMTQGII